MEFVVVYRISEVGYCAIVDAKDEVEARKGVEDRVNKAYPGSGVEVESVKKVESVEKKKTVKE